MSSWLSKKKTRRHFREMQLEFSQRAAIREKYEATEKFDVYASVFKTGGERACSSRVYFECKQGIVNDETSKYGNEEGSLICVDWRRLLSMLFGSRGGIIILSEHGEGHHSDGNFEFYPTRQQNGILCPHQQLQRPLARHKSIPAIEVQHSCVLKSATRPNCTNCRVQYRLKSARFPIARILSGVRWRLEGMEDGCSPAADLIVLCRKRGRRLQTLRRSRGMTTVVSWV